MEQVYVQESRKEIRIVLSKHFPDRLSALEEGAKILQREALRERSNPDRNKDWGKEDL